MCILSSHCCRNAFYMASEIFFTRKKKLFLFITTTTFHLPFPFFFLLHTQIAFTTIINYYLYVTLNHPIRALSSSLSQLKYLSHIFIIYFYKKRNSYMDRTSTNKEMNKTMITYMSRSFSFGYLYKHFVNVILFVMIDIYNYERQISREQYSIHG